jgi:hypothetical protein
MLRHFAAKRDEDTTLEISAAMHQADKFRVFSRFHDVNIGAMTIVRIAVVIAGAGSNMAVQCSGQRTSAIPDIRNGGKGRFNRFDSFSLGPLKNEM